MTLVAPSAAYGAGRGRVGPALADRVLRVRMPGPRDRRIRQAMRLRGVDEDTAADTVRRLDRTHAEYFQHFYGADIEDPSRYHLMIDSTAIGLEACVDLIVVARTALAGQ